MEGGKELLMYDFTILWCVGYEVDSHINSHSLSVSMKISQHVAIH